ncbi:sensor histidine kinase [Kitasatospora sp. NPDC018058]|uniref:sensor histidine kinase n=1 Tax=Kitasatospora sp. NPDC018058 TaxID=3364025 RepID=UPI0037C1A2F9
MHRLNVRLRTRPMTVDAGWAGLLLVIGLLHASRFAGPQLAWRAASAVLLAALLVVRRRAPGPAAVGGVLLGVGQLVLDVAAGPASAGYLALAYTAAAYGPVWASRLALAGGALAGPLAVWRFDPGGPTAGWPRAALLSGFLATPFILCWAWGRLTRVRRAYLTELEDRAARLERERDAQAKVAVAAERARIARELHDVVAHNVSVMIVQADGAAYVLDNSPRQAKEALGTIASTGRQALVEMRRLLGVLRTSDTAEEYVPQPGVEKLPELLEQVRTAGLQVDYATSGHPRELPRGVELTVYRIVQEALTNVRKHGGPDVHARVAVDFGERELAVLVEDDGRGSTDENLTTGGADGPGHGLIGMRERVGMVSGSLDVGPRPGGGFRIRAILPLKTPS